MPMYATYTDMDSPITFREILSVTVPATLVAPHTYVPSSASWTLLTVRELPSELIWNLVDPVVTGDPFLVHDWTGAGSPVAEQVKVTEVPLTAVTALSSAEIVGVTGKIHRE